MSTIPVRRVSARKYRGIGDVVAVVARPVAWVSDKMLRTNLSKCAGCAARQEALNDFLSFERPHTPDDQPETGGNPAKESEDVTRP